MPKKIVETENDINDVKKGETTERRSLPLILVWIERPIPMAKPINNNRIVILNNNIFEKCCANTARQTAQKCHSATAL